MGYYCSHLPAMQGKKGFSNYLSHNHAVHYAVSNTPDAVYKTNVAPCKQYSKPRSASIYDSGAPYQ